MPKTCETSTSKNIAQALHVELLTLVRYNLSKRTARSDADTLRTVISWTQLTKIDRGHLRFLHNTEKVHVDVMHAMLSASMHRTSTIYLVVQFCSPTVKMCAPSRLCSVFGEFIGHPWSVYSKNYPIFMVLSTKIFPIAHHPFVKGKWMRKSEKAPPTHAAPTEIVEQKSQIDSSWPA